MQIKFNIHILLKTMCHKILYLIIYHFMRIVLFHCLLLIRGAWLFPITIAHQEFATDEVLPCCSIPEDHSAIQDVVSYSGILSHCSIPSVVSHSRSSYLIVLLATQALSVLCQCRYR